MVIIMTKNMHEVQCVQRAVLLALVVVLNFRVAQARLTTH